MSSSLPNLEWHVEEECDADFEEVPQTQWRALYLNPSLFDGFDERASVVLVSVYDAVGVAELKEIVCV